MSGLDRHGLHFFFIPASVIKPKSVIRVQSDFVLLPCRLAVAFAEGVAGYVETKRQTRCRRQDERAWKAVERLSSTRQGGLMPDLGQRSKRFRPVVMRMGCRLRRKLSGLRRDKAADKNADTRTKALGNPEKGPRLPIAPPWSKGVLPGGQRCATKGAKGHARTGKGGVPRTVQQVCAGRKSGAGTASDFTFFLHGGY